MERLPGAEDTPEWSLALACAAMSHLQLPLLKRFEELARHSHPVTLPHHRRFPRHPHLSADDYGAVMEAQPIHAPPRFKDNKLVLDWRVFVRSAPNRGNRRQAVAHAGLTRE